MANYLYSLRVLSAHDRRREGSRASRLIQVRQEMEVIGTLLATTILEREREIKKTILKLGYKTFIIRTAYGILLAVVKCTMHYDHYNLTFTLIKKKKAFKLSGRYYHNTLLHIQKTNLLTLASLISADDRMPC